MNLAKWDDGYVFDADPRREDPLYYYLRDGAWGSAIGIEVGPLYEEHTASHVTIRVWPQHLPLEAGLEAAKWGDMYPRVISVLLRRFPKWRSVTLQSSRMPELAELGLVAAAFTQAGFSRSMSSSNEETWTRTRPHPPLGGGFGDNLVYATRQSRNIRVLRERSSDDRGGWSRDRGRETPLS